MILHVKVGHRRGASFCLNRSALWNGESQNSKSSQFPSLTFCHSSTAMYYYIISWQASYSPNVWPTFRRTTQFRDVRVLFLYRNTVRGGFHIELLSPSLHLVHLYNTRTWCGRCKLHDIELNPNKAYNSYPQRLMDRLCSPADDSSQNPLRAPPVALNILIKRRQMHYNHACTSSYIIY